MRVVFLVQEGLDPKICLGLHASDCIEGVSFRGVALRRASLIIGFEGLGGGCLEYILCLLFSKKGLSQSFV